MSQIIKSKKNGKPKGIAIKKTGNPKNNNTRVKGIAKRKRKKKR